jgi:hypothetical protein
MRGAGFDDARTPEGLANVEVDAETGGHGDVAGRGRPRADTLYERVHTDAWPDQDIAA